METQPQQQSPKAIQFRRIWKSLPSGHLYSYQPDSGSLVCNSAWDGSPLPRARGRPSRWCRQCLKALDLA